MPPFDRHRFDSFDGTAISYLDSGTSGPVALLLHGFLIDGPINFGPADHIMAMMASFAPPGAPALTIDPSARAGVAARLADAGFRVLVPDMRGHGQSDKPNTTAGYRDRAMARDMIALLDRLEIPRAGVLGYSMGSATTAHLIAEAPDRVSAAILGGIGASIVAGEPMDLPPEFTIPDRVPRPVTISGFSEYSAAILDGSAPPEGFGATYAVVADQFGVDRQVAASVLRGQMADAVAPAALRAFDRPVMVLNGDQDAAAFRTEAQFAQYLPRVTFTRCAGDHLSAVLDPGFQAAVVRHLQMAA